MPVRRSEEFTHSEAKLDGIRIHYVREGRGPPLLLMHGWPGFWWEWYKCIGTLANDFDVIAPDMRGFGDLEKPDLSDLSKYHLNVVTDDHAKLLKSVGIDRAYVVGHDYSALIMHKFVRRYRDMVIKGLTIDPIAPGFEARYLSVPHFPESWYSQFHQLDMAVEVVGSSRAATKAYFKHFLSHWSFNKNLITDEEMEIYTDNFVKPGNVQGGFNFYRANLSLSSIVWTDLDRTISDVPMTFLAGMGDTVVPSVWTDLVTNWYNNYTIEYVPDGGHFLMMEKPELVIDRIRRMKA